VLSLVLALVHSSEFELECRWAPTYVGKLGDPLVHQSEQG